MYSMYSNLLSLTISELKGFPITTVQEQFSRSYTTYANNSSFSGTPSEALDLATTVTSSPSCRIVSALEL